MYRRTDYASPFSKGGEKSVLSYNKERSLLLRIALHGFLSVARSHLSFDGPIATPAMRGEIVVLQRKETAAIAYAS